MCEARAEHFGKRAAFYREKLKSFALLKPLRSDEDVDQVYGSTTISDASDKLETSLTRHEASEREFRFIAAHLIPGADYMLERHDLSLLGIGE